MVTRDVCFRFGGVGEERFDCGGAEIHIFAGFFFFFDGYSFLPSGAECAIAESLRNQQAEEIKAMVFMTICGSIIPVKCETSASIVFIHCTVPAG